MKKVSEGDPIPPPPPTEDTETPPGVSPPPAPVPPPPTSAAPQHQQYNNMHAAPYNGFLFETFYSQFKIKYEKNYSLYFLSPPLVNCKYLIYLSFDIL